MDRTKKSYPIFIIILVTLVAIVCYLLFRNAELSRELAQAAQSVGEADASEETDAQDSLASGDSSILDTSEFKKEGPYTIGFSNISMVNTWRVQFVRELEVEAEHQNVELIMKDAHGDPDKQVEDIQALLDLGIDALLLSPDSPLHTNEITNRAVDMGIPVIVLSTRIQGEENFTSYIGVDDYEFGYLSATWFVEQIGGRGNVIIIAGMEGTQITFDRHRAWLDVLATLPDKGENINVLEMYSSGWAYEQGREAMTDALSKYDNIDGIFSHGGALAQGAIEVMQEAGRDLVPITGESNNGFLKLWQELKPQGFSSVAPGYPTWLAAEGLRTALSILKGNAVAKYNIIPCTAITDDTLAKYVRTDLSDDYWVISGLTEEELERWYTD